MLTGQVAAPACLSHLWDACASQTARNTRASSHHRVRHRFPGPRFQAASQVRSGAFLGFDAKIDFSALSELDCAAAT